MNMFKDPPAPPTNSSPAAPVKVDNPPPSVVSRSHEPNTPAQDRWQADQDALDRMDPWRRDGKQTMLVRQADGSVVEVPRRDGGTNGVPATGDPANPGDPAQRFDPVRTEDGKIVLGEGLEFTDQQLRDLVAFKASEDTRQLTVPANPQDYRVELPTDLKLPPGVEFRIDANSPMVPAAQAFAKRHGFTQNQFSELVGLYAASTASETAHFNNARAAEVAKLGDAVNARVDAVRTWLRAMGGSDFDGLNRVLEMAPTAATVAGLEKLMQRFSSQGGGSYSGAHREVNQPERLSTEAYGKLTYSEKKEYAAKFGQR
jgi:hypothetical protein